MFAKLSALVSSGPVFPYTLGTQYATSWGNWSHYQGVAKEGEAKVSIFRLSALREDDTKLVAARNGVKRLRTVCSFAFPELFCTGPHTCKCMIQN